MRSVVRVHLSPPNLRLANTREVKQIEVTATWPRGETERKPFEVIKHLRLANTREVKQFGTRVIVREAEQSGKQQAISKSVTSKAQRTNFFALREH